MALHNQRTAYGQTLVELGREDKRIVVLEADLGKSTMSCFFQEEFPDRYFEMGIAEANMVSFAAGLSLTDKIAFTNSFAVFASGRPYDQIRQGVAIGRLNVKVIGSSAGLSDFGDGATHQAIEDIAIMRAIPNMTVIAPCDAIETKKAIRTIAEHDGPAYVRLCRNDVPDIFPEHEDFVIGRPFMLKEGKDVALFAMGRMVHEAIAAADILDREGISAKVVNVSTLKPLDESAIVALSEGMKGIVTVEEHSIVGGLASCVTFALRGRGTPIEAISIGDGFGQSAETYEELLAYYGLTAENIADKCRRFII